MGLTESEEDDDDKEEEQRQERRVLIRVVPRERFDIHYSNSTSCDASSGGCQADECGVDLKDAKQYHLRHRVCESHAKAASVLVKGIRQRFCQQCSRFHEISKFDSTKRSCRDRLAGHNFRRRKVVRSDQEAEDVKSLPTSTTTSKMTSSKKKNNGAIAPSNFEQDSN